MIITNFNRLILTFDVALGFAIVAFGVMDRNPWNVASGFGLMLLAIGLAIITLPTRLANE